MTKVKYTHLDIEQRNLIEHLLNQGKNFSTIGKILKIDRTTIAKEVKRNYQVKVPTYSKVVCANQKNCNVTSCHYNKRCYQANTCEKLSKPPYVCNACDKKAGCRYAKHYYFANLAQSQYEERISESKKGYDITEEEINLIEKMIVPLVKEKKQPINHIYTTNEEILCFSKPTFYRYVNDGVISLSNIDLPKQVKYKPRKQKKTSSKTKQNYIKHRSFDDFLSYLEKHPNDSVVEMDTVEGKKGGKCFLTLFVRKTSLLLIFLMDSKTQEEVNKVFLELRNLLGLPLYKKIFKIILTDNGGEFKNPILFERDLNTGKKISKVFYCDPYSSWQKSFIENSHKRIRIPFPKGTSFDELTSTQVSRLTNNIANLYKDKLKKTPYQMTEELFPDLLKCLGISYIKPNDVDLSNSNLLEDRHEESH